MENPPIRIRLRPPASELLQFVQDRVAPLIGKGGEGDDDDDSTDLLERAMMLITFGKSASMSSLEGLQLMEDLDAAILRHFDMSPTPLLTSIVRYMAMEQAKAAASSSEASGAACVVPQLADVGDATFSTTMASPPSKAATNGTVGNNNNTRRLSTREVIINTSSDEGVVPLATLLGGPSQADDS
ncbi:hypothetical protein FOZ62_006750, partial [Perkinsus olseni]